ncbi:hypothetical protein LG291_10595 [Cytobacillus firmus]|uniref:hypothetical protein n=1 Tax=Cytobacillus firmus TaxID=1399 RepID=UPI00384EA076
MLRNHTPDKEIQLQQKIIHLKAELAKYQSMLSPEYEKEQSERINEMHDQNLELIRKNDTLRKKLAILSEENMKQKSYMHIMQDSLYRTISKKNQGDFFVINEDKDLINSLFNRIYDMEVTFWEMHCKLEELYKENEQLMELNEKPKIKDDSQTLTKTGIFDNLQGLQEKNRILQEELLIAARYKSSAESAMEELRKEIKAYNEGNVIYPNGTERNEDNKTLDHFISEFEKKDAELEKALEILKKLEMKVVSIENKINNE